MSDGFKCLFTMVDHFTKYGRIIPLKDKTTKNVLGAFKKCITTHNAKTTLQTDNGTEFKNNIMNHLWLERNIQHIFGTPYYPQHQGAVEPFNKPVQDILTITKDYQKDNYRLADFNLTFYCIKMIDFIQPQRSLYGTMMNDNDKKLMLKK